MKTLKRVLVLFAFAGLMLVGCSDKSQSPIAPTDQAGLLRETGALGKMSKTPFTGFEYPTDILNEGDWREVGVRIWWHGFEFDSYFETSDPRVTGIAHVAPVDFNVDQNFKGTLHGKITIYPWEVEGGVWEGTWHGYINADGEEHIEKVAQGKGGSIDGMQLFISEVWPPGDERYGIITGYVQSH